MSLVLDTGATGNATFPQETMVLHVPHCVLAGELAHNAGKAAEPFLAALWTSYTLQLSRGIFTGAPPSGEGTAAQRQS